ncbi:MAG TPA: hypothetical protein VLY24_06780 [Bryobacteraceae bacterium]|nr:hypothetical protein [Bryobacteraceae bacterium]
MPELLRRRLGLLRGLADSLEQAQAALAGITPETLDHHTARQRELCRESCALAAAAPVELQIRMPAGLDDDVQVAARRVADLNRFYGALLRRRRRTVDIFCRVLRSSGTTYPAPTPPAHPHGKGIRAKG